MKDVKGYEGRYAVTEDGQVWSYKTKRFLKSKISRGYEQVVFSVENQQKTFSVHRLVAMAYIPNPEELPQVGHKDDNPSNNCVENLYWTNALENNSRAHRTNIISNQRKKQVFCQELNRVFTSMEEAAEELKINAKGISNCCCGKAKTCGGYHWRYADELLG